MLDLGLEMEMLDARRVRGRGALGVGLVPLHLLVARHHELETGATDHLLQRELDYSLERLAGQHSPFSIVHRHGQSTEQEEVETHADQAEHPRARDPAIENVRQATDPSDPSGYRTRYRCISGWMAHSLAIDGEVCHSSS